MPILALWLGASIVSAGLVVVAVARRGGEKMWIMNLVWPITALWAGPLGGLAYVRLRRAKGPHAQTAKATLHCGAGCTLGDLIAAPLSAAAPFAIFGHAIFGEWLYSLGLAFAFGVAFQYFTIVPMRHLSPRRGIVAALEADAASLAAWQLGMYGAMALARFAVLRRPLEPSTAVFWLAMQIAMAAGFATSYPVNRWLLDRGLKEAM